jgi:ParB family transcriptional regulator, chromosome partitioning protein
MTTTSAAEKLAAHGVEKKTEKVEKRRALGRGLASLLPGPWVVITQGPKPESFSHEAGTGKAADLPSSLRASEARAEGSRGVGDAEIARFALNVKSAGAPATLEPPASPELEAGPTGLSDPYGPALEEHLPHAASAAGQPAAVPKLAGPSRQQDHADEPISLPAEAESGVVGNRVVHLPIDVIEKNPYQTRSVFDEESLSELRDSIKEHGVVQPVVVRPAEEEGHYILVLGERRLRASRMAGKETVPTLVRRLSPQQAAEMTVLENIVREDLNPIEQAEAFRVLSLEFKLTQAQIADRIGLSRETVSNYMRLLRLPRKVMDHMLADRLSFSDAREILRLENDDYIEAVAEEVVTHKLKWDQIEDRVMRINGSFAMLPGQTLPGDKKKSGGARWMDPNVRAAQTDMERTLGMRVRIRDRHGKGKIVIEYASVDDYERVTSMLRAKQ